MRTIKFRGFNAKNSKWMYGSHIINRGKYFVAPDEFADDKTWEDYEVEPETIGQFTGLHDKNGKEIYEGDIVRSTNSNEFVYEVVYDDKRFASFGLRRKQDVFMHYFGEAIEAEECEVIGNRSDNLDLLK